MGYAWCRDKVTKAMKVCARNAFLPEAHRNPQEAFMESPIHLDGLQFNVSPPNMHATCLVRPPLAPYCTPSVPASRLCGAAIFLYLFIIR